MLVVGCAPQDTRALGDAGPCGRGKARSCQCEDGSKGISQCTRGDDWGECVCNPSELELEPDASFSDNDAGSEGEPAFADCESRFDFRAHAPGDFAAPFRVPARSLLPGSEYQRVCFYFRVPYVFDSVALGFSALLYETPGLRSWMLYGLDKTTHADGEIGACNGAEPGAYLLAAFAPGVSDVRLPDDVGLALPHGSRAGMVLEVQYASGSEELLDRTGVRICGARTSARAHTAAVHFTGSQGICIPPAARNYEVRGSCEPRTDRGPIHVLDVWPSMHQHGRRMQITVNRASGQREPLHDAPFAFDDQQRFPAHDVTLLPGDTLETHCYFDNDSLVPISFGESADEETCFGFITAWPAGSLASNPLGALGSALGIEPDRSCLNPADILLSCTGAADAL
ncbi:MAG TPA: hypothetical protein VFX59_08505 [Polyangiales bacterium]|nr:hypothetical protein [Polyangiales bacterium]